MSLVSSPTKTFVLQQFDETYEQKSVVHANLLSSCFAEWPTERPTERYTYLESVPQMRIWMRNEPREAKGFRAVSWTTDTCDYQVKIEWNRNDDQDHQGRRGIKEKAMAAANTAASMPIRFVSQVFESATDHQLLPGIPTAPDGAAPFATTAGGANRFGVSSGNLLTGTSSTTPTGQNIRTDFFTALQQFLSFTDTEGFPLWDPEVLMSGGVTIMYPIAMMEAMAEAFNWARPIYKDTGSSTTDVTVGAATTNIVQDFNVKVTPMMNSYLTDDIDWYIGLTNVPVKPVYRGIQQTLQSDIWDRSNSDRARDDKIEAVGWDARWSIGVGPMYGWIKVNNT